jgi:hypothetical protein
MLPILLNSYIAYSDYSRDPWTSSETHRQNRKSQRSDNNTNPYYAPTGGTSRQEHVSRREENILLSGDMLRGPRPPGKAMTEKVVASDPRPRGEGRMPQGQEQEGRRKRLPRELRIKLYEEVKKLRRNGLTYKEIIE